MPVDQAGCAICPCGWERRARRTVRAGGRLCRDQEANIPRLGSSLSLPASGTADAPAAWGRCGACSLHGDRGLGWHPCVPGPGLAASLNTAFGHLGILCRTRDGFVALGNCASSGSQRLPDTGAPGGAQELHLLMKEQEVGWQLPSLCVL